MSDTYFALIKDDKIVKVTSEDLSKSGGVDEFYQLKVTKAIYDEYKKDDSLIYRTKSTKEDNSFSVTEISQNPNDPYETFTYSDVYSTKELEILPRTRLSISEVLKDDATYEEIATLNGVLKDDLQVKSSSIDRYKNILDNAS